VLGLFKKEERSVFRVCSCDRAAGSPFGRMRRGASSIKREGIRRFLSELRGIAAPAFVRSRGRVGLRDRRWCRPLAAARCALRANRSALVEGAWRHVEKASMRWGGGSVIERQISMTDCRC